MKESSPLKKLYVGNIPFQASEAELEQWFTQSGISVSRVNVIRDHFSGESRGFGFAEVDHDEEAERAIQACNGKPFMGRPLVVNEARPRDAAAGGARTQVTQGRYRGAGSDRAM
jgi:RNA recognition motif-containing protein